MKSYRRPLAHVVAIDHITNSTYDWKNPSPWTDPLSRSESDEGSSQTATRVLMRVISSVYNKVVVRRGRQILFPLRGKAIGGHVWAHSDSHRQR